MSKLTIPTYIREHVHLGGFTLQIVSVQKDKRLIKITCNCEFICIKKINGNKNKVKKKGEGGSNHPARNNTAELHKYMPDKLISKFTTSN